MAYILVIFWLVGSVAVVHSEEKAPSLLMTYEQEGVEKTLSLTLDSATIRFSGNPCHCFDSRGIGRGAGRVHLHFSDRSPDKGEDTTHTAFINRMVGPIEQEASEGNPSISFYMPNESVWFARRTGQMSIIEEIGHPSILISDYKCLGESASATIKIQSELVFAEDQLDMSLGPHDSPRRAAARMARYNFTLPRALLAFEKCPESP
jgi:hypothetical protein